MQSLKDILTHLWTTQETTVSETIALSSEPSNDADAAEPAVRDSGVEPEPEVETVGVTEEGSLGDVAGVEVPVEHTDNLGSRGLRMVLPGPSEPLDSHPENIKRFLCKWNMKSQESLVTKPAALGTPLDNMQTLLVSLEDWLPIWVSFISFKNELIGQKPKGSHVFSHVMLGRNMRLLSRLGAFGLASKYYKHECSVRQVQTLPLTFAIPLCWKRCAPFL